MPSSICQWHYKIWATSCLLFTGFFKSKGVTLEAIDDTTPRQSREMKLGKKEAKKERSKGKPGAMPQIQSWLCHAFENSFEVKEFNKNHQSYFSRLGFASLFWCKIEKVVDNPPNSSNPLGWNHSFWFGERDRLSLVFLIQVKIRLGVSLLFQCIHKHPGNHARK